MSRLARALEVRVAMTVDRDRFGFLLGCCCSCSSCWRRVPGGLLVEGVLRFPLTRTGVRHMGIAPRQPDMRCDVDVRRMQDGCKAVWVD